jgi:FkbM family methyltransferase
MRILRRLKKAFHCCKFPLYRRALRLGVAAAIEHEQLFKAMNFSTIVDVGANRGQFSLLARRCFPSANIISFEPLPGPAKIFKKVFSADKQTTLFDTAIGPVAEETIMHLSARDDSSSLLAISSLQEENFPGTDEIGTVQIKVAPLDNFLSQSVLVGPALLKLDVQGFELEALIGCETLLESFEMVYCECSFIELYSSQKLARDIILWLSMRGLYLVGVHNPSYDVDGRAIQADFLFSRV